MNCLHAILDCIGKFEEKSGSKAKSISVSPTFAKAISEQFPDIYSKRKLYGLDFTIDPNQPYSILIQ